MIVINDLINSNSLDAAELLAKVNNNDYSIEVTGNSDSITGIVYRLNDGGVFFELEASNISISIKNQSDEHFILLVRSTCPVRSLNLEPTCSRNLSLAYLDNQIITLRRQSTLSFVILPLSALERNHCPILSLTTRDLKFDHIIDVIIQSINQYKRVEHLVSAIGALRHLLLLSFYPSASLSGKEKDYKKIEVFIYQNVRNPDLNLNFASKNLGMSRRKIQAILQKNGTSYLKLVNTIRVGKLKAIMHESITLQSATSLDFSLAGFKSYNSARSAFIKIEGKSIKEYKCSLSNVG
ncbi:hypothetical protein VP758_005201 [Vibrio harveyi]|nr:hypothetical protein [Vibrio harveyi]